jgi:zinc protease
MKTSVAISLCMIVLTACAPVTKDVDMLRLPSGLSILTAPSSSEIVAVQVNVRGGLSAEPDGMDGLAYLTGNLLFRGAETRGNDEIIAELDFLSARVNVIVHSDFTAIRLVCLDENFDAAWDIVAECLTRPVFDSTFFELQKVGLRNEIDASQDDMASVAEAAVWSTMFAEHGYGHPSGGRPESLAAITRDDVIRHYRETYTSPNTTVVIVAGKRRAEIRDLVAASLSMYPSGESEWNAVPPVVRTPPPVNVPREKLQTVIVAAYPVGAVRADEFPVLALTAQILGGGIGSRLWTIRQRHRLAYSVGARYDQFKHGGAIRLTLGTTASKADSAREILDDVVRQLTTGGTSAEELAAAKTTLVADAMRAMETSAGRAARLSTFDMLGLGADYASTFESSVQGVTIERIQEKLTELFSSNTRVDVFAGPVTVVK